MEYATLSGLPKAFVKRNSVCRARLFHDAKRGVFVPPPHRFALFRNVNIVANVSPFFTISVPPTPMETTRLWQSRL